MKMWIRLGIGVAAVAFAVAIGSGAYAMYGSDDATPKHEASQALAAPPVDDASAAGGGGAVIASCHSSMPDCKELAGADESCDSSINPNGSTTDSCAGCVPAQPVAEPSGNSTTIEPAIDLPLPAPDPTGDGNVPGVAPELKPEPGVAVSVICADPGCTPEECSQYGYGSCTISKSEDGATEETCSGCAFPAPMPPVARPPSQPGAGEPTPIAGVREERPDVAPPPTFDPGAIGMGCLGIDPCSVSSRPLCLPGDCTTAPDGVIECAAIPRCEMPYPMPAEPDAKRDPKPAMAEPCLVIPCGAGDRAADAADPCPNPCLAYAPDHPEGLPCETIPPCVAVAPIAGIPKGAPIACPPPPASGSGSSGVGGAATAGGSASPGATGAATPAAPTR